MAAQLRAERPGTGVVLLSQHADATFALRLLEGGAGGRAYLLKERVGDVGELTAAVRTVADGGSVIDPTVVEQLVAANQGPRKTPLDHADAARARGARRDGPGQEQRGDRRHPRAVRAGDREAHQLDLRQARA